MELSHEEFMVVWEAVTQYVENAEDCDGNQPKNIQDATRLMERMDEEHASRTFASHRTNK